MMEKYSKCNKAAFKNNYPMLNLVCLGTIPVFLLCRLAS